MPVITPQFEITIKGASATYRIPVVQRVKIVSSRKEAADKATIELPMMSGLDLNTFKPHDSEYSGDEVTIKLGHKETGSIQTVFLGYVASVGPNLPVTIECEDIWSLIRDRKRSEAYNFSSVLFSAIGQDLIDDVSEVDDLRINAPDTSREMLDNFHVDRQSYEQIFSWLTQHSGWDFFVIPGTKTFYFGPGLYSYEHKEQLETPILRYGLNLLRTDLKWKDQSSVDEVIVHTSDADFKTRGKNLAGSYTKPGISDPKNVVELFFVGIKDKATGDARAQEEFSKLDASGFQGRFSTFGQSGLTHSMKCRIDGVDPRHPDSPEFIERIVYNYGPSNGFKMQVHLDPAMSVGAT